MLKQGLAGIVVSGGPDLPHTPAEPAVLRAAGLGFEHVASVRVFLTRMEDYQAMNSVYARHFTEPFPARTAVAVSALPLGASVEIDMIAKA